MKQNEPTITIPHWKLIQGNKFRYAINALMLSPKGYAMRIKCSLVGEPRGLYSDDERLVVFDREYVVEKIKRTLIGPLEGIRYTDLQKLIAECWRSSKADE